MADGLLYPASFVLLPGEGVLVAERAGTLRLLSTQEGSNSLISGVPPVLNLLDVAIAPDFAVSQRILLSVFQNERGRGAHEVWSARLQGRALHEVRRWYRERGSPRGFRVLQSGRMLVLGPATVLVSVSDVDDRYSLAQSDAADAGKILLVQEHGPATVVARGVRNVQGLTSRGPQIWFTDHGPRGGDELNTFASDANYGWPLVSAGAHYDGAPIPTQAPADLIVRTPVVHWTPSVAPSSLTQYAGDEFPEWRGSLLAGMLAGRQLRRLQVADERVLCEQALLTELGERIRDVRVDERGRVYVLTDGVRGRLLRLTRKVRTAGRGRVSSRHHASARAPPGSAAPARHRRAHVHRLDAEARHRAMPRRHRRRVSGAQRASAR